MISFQMQFMVWTIIVGYPLYFYTLYACVVATTSWDNVRLMAYYCRLIQRLWDILWYAWTLIF